MAHTIYIVHVDTGLVAERASDTLTSDLPSDIDGEATRAAIDQSGRLHYMGADGRAHVCEATTRSLGERATSDTFLLPGRARGGDAGAWVPLNVCVVEPALPGDPT
jgi:hypothetical protein